MAKILISGGSGLIGSNLSKILELHGHEVMWLSRDPSLLRRPSYYWDPEKCEADVACLNGTSIIINLSGAGVADKRWTHERKEEILDSRIKSVKLLYKLLQDNRNQVSTVIGASAVGFYGNRRNELLTEESTAGSGFLADVCNLWEYEYQSFRNLGIRTAIVRIGVVLSKDGGYLKELLPLAKLGLAAPLGKKTDYTPWIHITDLCRIFVHLAENPSLSGIYNGVAPVQAQKGELTRKICQALKRPQWLPSVPAFLLRMTLGERADIILTNQRISAEKLQKTGFHFQYPDPDTALMEILRNK